MGRYVIATHIFFLVTAVEQIDIRDLKSLKCVHMSSSPISVIILT